MVCFLDIDGVLWTPGWAVYATRNQINPMHQWCPISTSNLIYLLETLENPTEAKHPPIRMDLVVSSSWRSQGLEKMWLYAKRSGLDPDRIIDVTPKLPGKERGAEIEQWIKQNPIDRQDILILDDDNDMVPYMDRLYRTKSNDGFTFSAVMDLLSLLHRRDF